MQAPCEVCECEDPRAALWVYLELLARGCWQGVVGKGLLARGCWQRVVGKGLLAKGCWQGVVGKGAEMATMTNTVLMDGPGLRDVLNDSRQGCLQDCPHGCPEMISAIYASHYRYVLA